MSVLSPRPKTTPGQPVRVESPEPFTEHPRKAAPAEPAPHSAPVTQPAPKASAPRKRNLKRLVGIPLLVLATIGGAAYGYSYWQWSRVHEITDNAFIDAHIVQVSTRVTGHVARVLVDDNQVVKAGDVLVELDPADYQAALDEAASKVVAAEADFAAAKSAVEQARAQVNAAEATVAQAKAELSSKEAELQRADTDLAQYARAKGSGSVSTLEYGKAETTHRTAEAAVEAARKAVAAAEANVAEVRSTVQAREGQVAVAEAQITAAKAAAEKAKLNLSYTKITATENGRVTKKSVEPGNYIIPGQPLFALVSPQVWVTANFKETQLSEMKPGQEVELEVDAYPGMKLKGHVDSIQQGAGARFSLLPPENATGNYVKVVQRVPVKILIDEQPVAGDARVLGPGMSVVPTVTLKTPERPVATASQR
jgi:membrane fusion protein (multidrug efflux system)